MVKERGDAKIMELYNTNYCINILFPLRDKILLQGVSIYLLVVVFLVISQQNVSVYFH